MSGMHNKLWCLITALLLAMPIAAQTDKADKDSIINKEAESPTFITTSLLVIEPGEAPYSAYGHSAIRMQCPSKGLDYCFSFEMPVSMWGELAYVVGKAKGGFKAVETQAFLDEYRNTKRGIKAYNINLAPKEKQKLWQVLDNEVSEGYYWDYKLPHVNCANMCQYVIEQCLDNGKIVYGKLNPLLTDGTYEEMFQIATKNRPWTRLLYYICEIGHWKDKGELEDKLTPVLLAETWSHSCFKDKYGTRPVLTGKPKQLVPAMYKTPDPMFFTPTVAVILLVAVIVILILIVRYKHNNKRKI